MLASAVFRQKRIGSRGPIALSCCGTRALFSSCSSWLARVQGYLDAGRIVLGVNWRRWLSKVGSTVLLKHSKCSTARAVSFVFEPLPLLQQMRCEEEILRCRCINSL